MKGFILMMLILVGGWLWVNPDARRGLAQQWQRWQHGLSNAANLPITVKQIELQPMAGSGAYDALGKTGQGIKGMYGQ